ncbi:MlaD family protein [Nocardia neocaledoniensis]|uniref:MlaD family protein n=1 Tax=Nocardia neocaledoniensis TaxID=236511 RepID=UPI0024562D6E|nr:MlaD family protein [Nocardia neocaledoniensis]
MAAIAVLSFVYMDSLGLQTGAFEDRKTASMSVTDTNGLVTGAKVLLRGVEIGHITGVDTSAKGVQVDWNYEAGYQIPVDSRFRVDNLSALGETYLAVLPAASSGPYLDDGAVIDASHVTVPTTFKELSEKLTRFLEQVEPARVQELFKEINISLPDDVRVLGNLNAAGELLAAAMTRESDNLALLLNTIQPMLLDSATIPSDLARTTPHLAGFGHGFNELVDGIYFAMVFSPLRDAVKYGAKPLIADGLQVFLDKSAADLNILGTDLLPAARAAGAALQTVDISQLFANAMRATESGNAVTINVPLPGGG